MNEEEAARQGAVIQGRVKKVTQLWSLWAGWLVPGNSCVFQSAQGQTGSSQSPPWTSLTLTSAVRTAPTPRCARTTRGPEKALALTMPPFPGMGLQKGRQTLQEPVNRFVFCLRAFADGGKALLLMKEVVEGETGSSGL